MSHISHTIHLHCTAPLQHCTAHAPALPCTRTCTAPLQHLHCTHTCTLPLQHLHCTALFIILNKSKFRCYYIIGLQTKLEEISSFITMLYSGVHKLCLTIKRRGAKMIYSYHEFRHMSRF